MKRALAVLFGIGVAVKTSEEQVCAFNQHLGGKTCNKCFTLFNGRAWMGFIFHLMDVHGVDSEVAYEIVNDLAKRFVIKCGTQGRLYETRIADADVTAVSESAVSTCS
jgi:hypothetical protein